MTRRGEYFKSGSQALKLRFTSKCFCLLESQVFRRSNSLLPSLAACIDYEVLVLAAVPEMIARFLYSLDFLGRNQGQLHRLRLIDNARH